MLSYPLCSLVSLKAGIRERLACSRCTSGDPFVTDRQGCTVFFPQKSRRQKGDIKQHPRWVPTDIRGNRTKFGRPGFVLIGKWSHAGLRFGYGGRVGTGMRHVGYTHVWWPNALFVWCRQMVGRLVLETLPAVADDPADLASVMAVVRKLADDPGECYRNVPPPLFVCSSLLKWLVAYSVTFLTSSSRCTFLFIFAIHSFILYDSNCTVELGYNVMKGTECFVSL
jgi:hypothetical protein